ncbi:Hypothetical_protein [Hexamita inflata]|uniref:Hypothetical_protein n=1 Tax=Hexamita inflata TaxID=28002 RepID=A0AA86TJ54_9EUKA|nr:Hypothetical protein HINF_LOCUS6705 [Hexamita inflata]
MVTSIDVIYGVMSSLITTTGKRNFHSLQLRTFVNTSKFVPVISFKYTQYTITQLIRQSQDSYLPKIVTKITSEVNNVSSSAELTQVVQKMYDIEISLRQRYCVTQFGFVDED